MPRLLECAVQLYCVSRQRKKKMTVPLRISSASNLILALIVLLVQVWLAVDFLPRIEYELSSHSNYSFAFSTVNDT